MHRKNWNTSIAGPETVGKVRVETAGKARPDQKGKSKGVVGGQ